MRSRYLSRAREGAAMPACGGGLHGARKPVFSPLFMLKMIVLPRQARDKHRENF